MTDRMPTWNSSAGKTPPKGDEVDLWRIALDDPHRSPEALRRDLTDDELRRADAFHFERDRRRFVVARAALRRILAKSTGLQPGALSFRYGDQGKPRLLTPNGDDGLRFNLSHSRGLAICGVTRGQEIGVDVERVRTRVEIDRIAQRFFSPREYQALRSIDPERRREAFFRCWTRKEACLKAIGRGIFSGSTRFDVTLLPDEPAQLIEIRDEPTKASRWTVRDLSPEAGFVGAVVTSGRLDSLRHWRFEARA
jgi:4'-phosphopantetheinyl transferase